jgi:hypothetical protein
MRSPFLDIDLIVGVFTHPVGQRINPAHPKHLLKRMFARSLLEYLFDEPKVGFDDNFPYSDWIAGNWAQFSDVSRVARWSNRRYCATGFCVNCHDWTGGRSAACSPSQGG